MNEKLLEKRAENFIQNNMVNCIQEQVEYFTFAKQAYIAGATEETKEAREIKKMLKDVIDSYAHDERFAFERVLKRAEQFLGGVK